MSQKKCPKCGEMNPPEAVMCWACYTPLSGGAASAPGAPASSSPVGGPVVGDSEGAMKKPIPPAQLGVIGVGLLVLVGFGVKTFLAPAGGDDDDDDTPTAPAAAPSDAPAPAPAASPPGVPAPVPSAPAGVAVPPAQQEPFKIVTVPNAQYNWGTMAILLSNPNATANEAAAAAAFVRQRMMRSKKWLILHIYVFTDQEAAGKFRAYQTRRRGAPLESTDYRELSEIWARAPVRYEYNRGSQGVLWPSRNAGNWWNAKPTYTKVRD